jgi:hypothetical protein
MDNVFAENKIKKRRARIIGGKPANKGIDI